MVEVSSRVRDKDRVKWCAAIEPDLLPGESIVAAVAASRIMPMTLGTVITTRRILGINPLGAATGNRIRLEVSAHEIAGIDFPRQAEITKMRVRTKSGEVNFGTLYLQDEIDLAYRHVERLWHGGTAFDQQVRDGASADSVHAERRAQPSRERAQVTVVGPGLSDHWWNKIGYNFRPGEVPSLVINSEGVGTLTVLDDRLVLATSAVEAGTVFPFTGIDGIVYDEWQGEPFIEILSPQFPPIQGDGTSPWTANPVAAANRLPISAELASSSQASLTELQHKIARTKAPRVVLKKGVPMTSPVEEPAASGGLADELMKLADLHRAGMLDEAEFKEAKRIAFARLA